MALALPIGKLTIFVGAGFVGSVLAKDGHVPIVTDLFSGVYKIFFKLRQDDSPTRPKSDNDNLLKQIEFIRKELDNILPNRSTIIVTANHSGSRKYALIVLVVGCGYVWWKGWRISDMILATRRSLSDACASVAKQLEDVYSSISAMKKELSSGIECVDNKIDECTVNIVATRDEVFELLGDAKQIGETVQSFHSQVQFLETKISIIEEQQNVTNFGVEKLVAFASGLENGKIVAAIKGNASRPALELPKVASLSSTTSFEPPSPTTSNGWKQALSTPSGSSKSPASASGLKDLDGIFDGVGPSSRSSPEVSTSDASNLIEESPINGTSISRPRVVGRTFSRFGLLSRSRSEVQPTTSSTAATPKPNVVPPVKHIQYYFVTSPWLPIFCRVNICHVVYCELGIRIVQLVCFLASSA